MVNIVWGDVAVINLDHMADQADDIVLGDHAMTDRDDILQVQLLIQLIASNFFQVIMTRVKELLNDMIAGIIKRRRFTWAQAFVKLNQRCFSDRLASRQLVAGFLFKGRLNIRMFLVGVNIGKEFQNFFVRAGF